MDKEPVVKAGKTGEVLAKLPLARIGLACISLGLLLGGLLWYQTPGETASKTPSVIPPDTDGDVPVEGKCEPDGNPEWGKWVGRYQWKNVRDASGNVKEVQGVVYLNLCRMDDHNFTREEKLAVLRHEKAHSLGWNHGEGTPETNPAYHADYDLDR